MDKRYSLLFLGIFLLGIGASFLLFGTNKTSPVLSPSPQAVNSSASSSAEIAGSAREKAFVKRAIDGDTIELADGRRVRYIGIDTPETVDPRKPVQCFGREAANKNRELVEGKEIELEKDVSETDRYGRLLRYVYLPSGEMVNEILVREGFAHSSSYPPDIKYQQLFIEAERQAREENVGLWSRCVSSPTSNVESAPGTGTSGTQTNSNVKSSSACLIKGNISTSGEKIYHLPGCGSYDKTAIDEAKGKKWFCSETEAQQAGWRKAKNC